jgi:DNA-binding transcriptional LysR family regulator
VLSYRRAATTKRKPLSVEYFVLGRKLEYLIALAKEAHFARAAAACHVSQPTLSAAIQQLEAELGVQIVKRGQRFQGFTEEGEIILASAQRMAIEWNRVHQKLRDRSGDFSGTLRIGVLGSTIPLMRTFTIPFRQRYPNVNLRVMVQSAFDIHQAIEESAVDVAITYLDKKLRRYRRHRILYTEEYELLIRKGTPFSGRESVSWQDLKQLPLCLLSPDMHIFGSRESEILNETLSKTPHIITNAIWMVMDHVRTGNWASVLPRPVRIMISGDDDLEAIPLPITGKPISVAVAIPLREPVSPLAEAFFNVATSDQALRKLHTLLRTAGEVEHRDRKSISKPREIRRVTVAAITQ